MHPLHRYFRKFLRGDSWLNAGKTVLLAVSGGVDSMVLASLFQKENLPHAIAHCNFMLRGADSDVDEAVVQAWCKKHEITFHVRKFRIKNVSIQTTARTLRYEWFRQLVASNNYVGIATAHQLDDSLETFIINLTRGSGMQGFTGISSKTEDIFRPLSSITKDEIIDYAQKEKIVWREDQSNDSCRYRRNSIRWKVIPQLKVHNPNLLKTFQLTLERMQHAYAVVQQRVERVKQYLDTRQDVHIFQLQWIKDDRDLSVFSEILSIYGFNYATSKNIWKARDKPGKCFKNNYWMVYVDRDAIHITKEENTKEVVILIHSYGKYPVGNRTLTVEAYPTSDWKISKTNQLVLLDASRLKFPLKVRKWKPADRFRPLGMQGTKKISDFLIDKKLPLWMKKEVTVMIVDSDIAWVMGHRISEDFKLTKDTKKVIKLHYSDASK